MTNLLRLTSGGVDHVRSLGRIKPFSGHLARDNVEHMWRHESWAVSVTDVDDRVSIISNALVSCMILETSETDHAHRGTTFFPPVFCNSVSLVVVLMVEHNCVRPTRRTRKPIDSPNWRHWLAWVVPQVGKFNS